MKRCLAWIGYLKCRYLPPGLGALSAGDCVRKRQNSERGRGGVHSRVSRGTRASTVRRWGVVVRGRMDIGGWWWAGDGQRCQWATKERRPSDATHTDDVVGRRLGGRERSSGCPQLGLPRPEPPNEGNQNRWTRYQHRTNAEGGGRGREKGPTPEKNRPKDEIKLEARS